MNLADDNDNNEDNIMTDNNNQQQPPMTDDTDNDNPYELGPIYLNRWIDCQDEYNKWYEAQIIAIQPSNPRLIKVHYKGWKSKFDTWVDLNNEPERARLLHTFTDKPVKLGELSTFDIGTKCDCLDSTDKWYQAEIMEENQNGELVRIHYQGWDEKYDEWINKDSYRIAPLHTMTSPSATTNTRSTPSASTAKPKEPQTVQATSIERVTSPHKSSKRRGSSHNVSIKRKQPTKLKRNTSDNSNSSVRGGSGSGVRSASYASSGDDHDTTNHNITVLSDGDYDYKNNTTEQALVQQDTASPAQTTQPTEIKDEDHDDDDDPNDENNNNTTSKPDEAQISSEQYLRNFKPSLRDEQQFVDKLAVKGLQIVSMGEDGNCLFRSISHQVYGKEDFHMELRQKCVRYLQSEYDYFSAYVPGGGEKQTFDAYCTRMLRSGVWGDNLEIQAFSELYGRSIEIYAYDDKPMKSFSNQSSNNQNQSPPPNNNNGNNNGNSNNNNQNQQRQRPPIRLSYHCNSHYNSIINPQLHRMNLLSESKVGEVEDERIRLSYLRSVHANQNTMLLSDVEATDLAYFQQALKESRQMFDDNQLNEAVGNQQLDEVIKKSLAQYEKDALDQAMQDSMKHQENQEDMELRKALELSQMDYFGGGHHGNNDNMMNNDPNGNGNFDPNDNNQIGGLGGNINIGEYAVKVLVDKGYSLEQATMVWTVFEPQKDNFSKDVLVQKMIDYIQNITYSQNFYNLQ